MIPRAVLFLVLLILPALAKAAATADVAADLLEIFSTARITNSSSTELRRPASAGGVKQDALFEHPSPRRPARVEYNIGLPELNPAEFLLFTFETAIADGVTLSPAVDGVRFSVEVDGEKVFEEIRRETAWKPHMIDLARFGGRMVTLTLITDEVGNSSYDWAVWGTPRVIRVSGATKKPRSGRDVVYSPKLQLMKLGPTQAIIREGESAAVRAEVKNVGYGPLPEGEAKVDLRGSGLLAVPALAPGATWIAEWRLLRAEPTDLEARVGTNILRRRLEVSRPMLTNSISNDRLRLDFIRERDGYAFARIFGREQSRWTELGVWAPLFRTDDWTVRPLTTSSHDKSSIEFVQAALAPDGREVQVRLRVTLDRKRPLARIHYEWGGRTNQTLWGPNIYVGTSAAKAWGLFPGLEYLYGPERSSNPRDFAAPLHDRRSPPTHQITIPLMAVTIARYSVPPAVGTRFFTPDSLMDHSRFYDESPQHTVSLQWEPGKTLSRFASPNFDEHMDNHRMGLFATNGTSLDATLVITDGPALKSVREWLLTQGGLPKPNPWPRTFHEELALCRTGFLKTVSDEKGEKFRHCIGWGAGHSPGFATLLWLDSRIATNRDSAARVDLVARQMGSGAAFTSQANCHIMQWEFPFVYGHLPEAFAHLEGFIAGLIKSQQTNGSWVYQPANKEQADLGRAGDSVLGTCANRASSLLRYARITGDRKAFEAGEKALRFMEMFRVPRGGQTWECPMYEPDILAAAYAIRAYHDAYRITGDQRWLRQAVYWAETGVPFNYLWSLPNKPMMLGASIPVFGSTFYTHSWLGMPVQWCGLVYAYHVFHLAEELEAAGKDRPSGVMNFSPADWKRLVELITVSGMYQQFAEGDKIGTYPDSITDFEKRNPAFLNPEDILVNVLALKGYDPDIKTVRIGSMVISSAAKISKPRITGKRLRFELEWFENDFSHSLIHCDKPTSVSVNGSSLARGEWQWDEKRKRTYIRVKHSSSKASVELQIDGA